MRTGTASLVGMLTAGLLTVALPARAQSAAAPADEEAPSVRELAGALRGDFRRSISIESASVLAVAGALSLAVHTTDRRATGVDAAPTALEEFLDLGAASGAGYVQIGGAVLAYAAGRASGHSTLAGVGAELTRAQMVAGLYTQALKLTVRRTRPDGGAYSFPSGHTSASFASATVLQHRFGLRAGIPAYALATYVGMSRVTDRRHFPSDVCFGAGLGLIAGRAVASHGAHGAVIQPLVARGAAGLSVTWTPAW